LAMQLDWPAGDNVHGKRELCAFLGCETSSFV
jgi:hypothetical protein